uniref:EGL-17 (inferred by orthology to a C. elegans protein) n=1 Tax=Anisakis simplex TaxID=6269 RepID=A0A158PNL2_ANISI
LDLLTEYTNLQCRILTGYWLVNLMSAVEGITVWQLYNHCSSAFVQSYMRHANARGHQSSHCLTDFIVQLDSQGRLQLENALTGKFVCFNKRQRLSVRNEGSDEKCFFRERLTPNGYTEFESTWRPFLFLGFNRKGRFQDPSLYSMKRKCFLFTKLRREVPSTTLKHCSAGKRRNQKRLSEADRQRAIYDAVRESLLSQIRALP